MKLTDRENRILAKVSFDPKIRTGFEMMTKGLELVQDGIKDEGFDFNEVMTVIEKLQKASDEAKVDAVVKDVLSKINNKKEQT